MSNYRGTADRDDQHDQHDRDGKDGKDGRGAADQDGRGAADRDGPDGRAGRDAQLTAEAVELRVAIGRVARRMRQLYAADDGGPSFTELAVLLRLDRNGPVTPTELAGRERVTSQAVAIVVRALERRELVTRSPSPQDGRSTVLAITDAGRAVLRDREQAVVARLIRVLAESCTRPEQRQLAAVVPLLARLAESL